jgi:hypothetical protein
MTRTLRYLLAAVVAFALADVASAQVLSKPVRKTSVSYWATNAAQQWDEWETPPPDEQDADSELNDLFGQWRSDLEFNNPADYDGGPFNVWVAASQDSMIDQNSGIFWFYGYALSSLYIQGDAEAAAESTFQFDFKLNNSGRVVLQGVIGVSDFFGWDVAHDTPGQAKVVVKVVNLATNATVYEKVVEMNGEVPDGIDQFEFDDFAVELGTGNYRLVITATSSDSVVYDQVNFSLANAFVELEGWVEED